eukprot:COSAG06_NODE_15964_length_1032_cov_1.252947_1_plen_41_part_10
MRGKADEYPCKCIDLDLDLDLDHENAPNARYHVAVSQQLHL